MRAQINHRLDWLTPREAEDVNCYEGAYYDAQNNICGDIHPLSMDQSLHKTPDRKLDQPHGQDDGKIEGKHVHQSARFE